MRVFCTLLHEIRPSITKDMNFDVRLLVRKVCEPNQADHVIGHLGIRRLISTFVIIMILSRDMRFPTMWYVRPTKAQISLPICAV